MSTVAERIIAFNASLHFTGSPPDGIRVMNPFAENPNALEASSNFYKKYYDDTLERVFIVGINPGRFGAGLTGVPFTDPKRLRDECGIDSYEGPPAHEPSSAFIYAMIEKYGGVRDFYSKFYINSICPLGFVSVNAKGREVNYNYYDSKELALSARDFILETLKKQMRFNLRKDVCFCLGTGKNATFLNALNKEYPFCRRIVPLEHPRYIIQYKSKSMPEYIDKYLELLHSV
jgi:hypothetical protein